MADSKISALTETTTLAATDELVVASSGTTKKITGANLKAQVIAEATNATQSELDAHINDATAAHAASAISFTPNGSIVATDVQAAIQEVRDEAVGAPADATYIVQTANGSLSAEQVLSLLSTGLVKVTTGTGVLSTATAGTDYLAPADLEADYTAAFLLMGA